MKKTSIPELEVKTKTSKKVNSSNTPEGTKKKKKSRNLDGKSKDEKLDITTEELVRKGTEKEKKKARTHIFNIDYDNLTSAQQRQERGKARAQLFKHIGPYMAKKRAGALKKAEAQDHFEKFKESFTEHYSLPLENVKDAFNGGEERKADYQEFCTDFLKYLG